MAAREVPSMKHFHPAESIFLLHTLQRPPGATSPVPLPPALAVSNRLRVGAEGEPHLVLDRRLWSRSRAGIEMRRKEGGLSRAEVPHRQHYALPGDC